MIPGGQGGKRYSIWGGEGRESLIIAVLLGFIIVRHLDIIQAVIELPDRTAMLAFAGADGTVRVINNPEMRAGGGLCLRF